MLAVFRYIREHLYGNEQAIWELGDQLCRFGQQQKNNNHSSLTATSTYSR
jgi:hypothetical protein